MFVKADNYFANWMAFIRTVFSAPTDIISIYLAIGKRSGWTAAIIAGTIASTFYLVAWILVLLFGPFLALIGYQPYSSS